MQFDHRLSHGPVPRLLCALFKWASPQKPSPRQHTTARALTGKSLCAISGRWLHMSKIDIHGALQFCSVRGAFFFSITLDLVLLLIGESAHDRQLLGDRN